MLITTASCSAELDHVTGWPQFTVASRIAVGFGFMMQRLLTQIAPGFVAAREPARVLQDDTATAQARRMRHRFARSDPPGRPEDTANSGTPIESVSKPHGFTKWDNGSTGR